MSDTCVASFASRAVAPHFQFSLQLKVTSVPAFIFFKNGVEVNRMTGANFDKVEAMMKAEAGI
jgi:hypothetical protein